MNSKVKVKVIVSLMVSLLIVFPVYVVLHEGGHTLVAALCGAKITTKLQDSACWVHT